MGGEHLLTGFRILALMFDIECLWVDTTSLGKVYGMFLLFAVRSFRGLVPLFILEGKELLGSSYWILTRHGCYSLNRRLVTVFLNCRI